MSAVQSVLLYGSEVWADALNKEAYRLRLARVQRTFQMWQESWERETRGRWTARLIRQVQPWVERRHGEVDYYLTQFLSGHGYFQSYLHLMAKTNSPDCIYCPCIPDDAEHTFFHCPQWDMLCQEAIQHLGVLSIESICETLLKGEDNWDCWSHFVRNVLQA
ncbi:uncharacterized protein LOC128984085 [Macrosteles quadrilineatus]|uniref:uncharacterized protein LOC128984085 n=1 Tax=Macrosteles quadrilineatus TaxID=74068 RepID=UPI0023E1E158|nr:uncharacterized protein LOC128984085 [Macrosteles quadrilineatus]